MEQKIKYKDLSKSLKIGIIGGYINIVEYLLLVLIFGLGFIILMFV